jgi:HD superfamily phosphohydrolase
MRLIDSQPMQRLRRIRQLGLACLAYQGAEHSRFTHSLGVMCLATRILDHLAKEWRISDAQRLAVRCAALLHDVGHGPFSHVFEQVTGMHHEAWTDRMLTDRTSEIHQILAEHSRALPSSVAAIIRGRSRPAFLSQVITSQLDADRFDYLLRDSLMTGVKYGVYELERLIRVLRLDHKGERIVVAANGIPPVEKYLQARYHMYTQVYLHKTVRAAEAMLVLLLRRARELALAGDHAAIDTTPPPLLRILRSAAAPPRLEDFLAVTDDTLFYAMATWRASSDPVLRTLATGLLTRQLFKTVDVSAVSNLPRRLAAARRYIASLGWPPEYFVLLYESRNVAYRPYDPRDRNTGHHILVETSAGSHEYADIAELSPVVAGLARATTLIRRVVFPERLGDIATRSHLETIFS